VPRCGRVGSCFVELDEQLELRAHLSHRRVEPAAAAVAKVVVSAADPNAEEVFSTPTLASSKPRAVPPLELTAADETNEDAVARAQLTPTPKSARPLEPPKKRAKHAGGFVDPFADLPPPKEKIKAEAAPKPKAYTSYMRLRGCR